MSAPAKRRRQALLLALNAGLVLVLLAAAGRALRAAATLPEAAARADARLGGSDRNRPLEGMRARVAGDPAGATVDLGTMRDGLLLVFDPACGPSALNVANWADLARELRGSGAALHALTLEPAEGAAEYWDGWAGIGVLAADSATMRDELRVTGTPVTLLVQDGAVRREYPGPLTRPALEDILRRLGGRGAGRAGP